MITGSVDRHIRLARSALGLPAACYVATDSLLRRIVSNQIAALVAFVLSRARHSLSDTVPPKPIRPVDLDLRSVDDKWSEAARLRASRLETLKLSDHIRRDCYHAQTSCVRSCREYGVSRRGCAREGTGRPAASGGLRRTLQRQGFHGLAWCEDNGSAAHLTPSTLRRKPRCSQTVQAT